MTRWCVLVMLAYGATTAGAQELVLNGSFEEHQRCPEGFGRKSFKGVQGVYPVASAPAYFHACASALGTPANWAGHQAPKDGDAYVGLVLTSRMGDRSDRQYVQLSLKEPLANGHRYRLSFWVSTADRAGYSTDRIGASFTTEDRPPKKGVLGMVGRPDMDNPLERYLADTAAWMKVEGIYHAKGGERSVIIGNFQPYGYSSRKALSVNSGGDVLRNTKRKHAMMNDPDPERSAFQRVLSQAAYVFLDLVSLIPLAENEVMGVLTQELACDGVSAPANGVEMVPDVHFDRNGQRGSSWLNASDGTPDLIEGRTGIYLYSGVNSDNREFISTPLTERTDPCGIYRVSMRVLRDASYGYAVDRIGIVLVDGFQKVHDRGPLPYAMSWASGSGLVMENASEWITFCGDVTGAGCATDLLVGNFSADSSTTVRQLDPNGGPFAYYFVDDVSLIRTGTHEGCTLKCDTISANVDPLVAEIAGVDGPVDLIPIRFGTASALADTLDGALLDRIRAVFLEHPSFEIRIQGHTDDSGTRLGNKALALARANAVRLFLVTSGIPNEKLVVEQFGSDRPVASNGTPEGKALNRRVELVLPKGSK